VRCTAHHEGSWPTERRWQPGHRHSAALHPLPGLSGLRPTDSVLRDRPSCHLLHPVSPLSPLPSRSQEQPGTDRGEGLGAQDKSEGTKGLWDQEPGLWQARGQSTTSILPFHGKTPPGSVTWSRSLPSLGLSLPIVQGESQFLQSSLSPQGTDASPYSCLPRVPPFLHPPHPAHTHTHTHTRTFTHTQAAHVCVHTCRHTHTLRHTPWVPDSLFRLQQ
jgi:hypothetical protein